MKAKQTLKLILFNVIIYTSYMCTYQDHLSEVLTKDNK